MSPWHLPAHLRRGVARLLLATSLLACTLPAVAAGPATVRIHDREWFAKSLAAAQGALREFGAWDEPEELARVQEIGFRIVEASGYRDDPFSFFLIDMPEPNAFALPGGHIFLTRGMFSLGLDDDQLAALLGHEIAHVVQRHGVRMQRRAGLLNILSTAAMVGVILAADGSSHDALDAPYYDPRGRGEGSNRTGDLIHGTMATSLIVSELLLRSYNREFETEADVEGQRWAVQAGYAADGAARLMRLMRERLPESREYGYWRTHPFFDQRLVGAMARARQLRVHAAVDAQAVRLATQVTLLDYAEHPEITEPVAPPRRPPHPGTVAGEPAAPALPFEQDLVRQAALQAWPQGPAAEALRLRRLHELRDRELRRSDLARDFGSLLRAYDEETRVVQELTPESPLLPRLAEERAAFAAQAEELRPQAVGILDRGIYETDFLATFLSNYPQDPRMPAAALALGDAYARLQKQHDAVTMYLRVLEAAPESPEAERASCGLRGLTPVLEDLAALQSLADEANDPAVREMAGRRLAERSVDFDRLEDGATYLRTYPEGAAAPAVRERLDQLADKLLSEILLYQRIGDHGKAVDRIHQVLSFAPLTPAADRLREGVTVES